MNWDTVKGDWKQFSGKVKQQWGKLTDEVPSGAGPHSLAASLSGQVGGCPANPAFFLAGAKQMSTFRVCLSPSGTHILADAEFSNAGVMLPADQRSINDQARVRAADQDSGP